MDPAATRAPARPPTPPPPAAAVAARDRTGRVVGLAAAAALTAYVGLVDPAGGGAYPVCPSRVLLGIDCPACGGLRGTHDLLHGQVAQALPAYLAVAAALAWRLAAPLLGRAAPALRVPRWAAAAAAVVVVTFTVARNLPAFGWLGSGLG
jgi:Protein of unknown function (DUF2752)